MFFILKNQKNKFGEPKKLGEEISSDTRRHFQKTHSNSMLALYRCPKWESLWSLEWHFDSHSFHALHHPHVKIPWWFYRVGSIFDPWWSIYGCPFSPPKEGFKSKSTTTFQLPKNRLEDVLFLALEEKLPTKGRPISKLFFRVSPVLPRTEIFGEKNCQLLPEITTFSKPRPWPLTCIQVQIDEIQVGYGEV